METRHKTSGSQNLSFMTHAVRRHVGIGCDNCRSHDFPGVRYKCSTCPDFDICENCIDEVEDAGTHPHPFIRIKFPLDTHRELPPFLSNKSNWIHLTDIRCACCDMTPIVGFRYFCTICGKNLCEKCEQAGAHNPSHSFLKMRPMLDCSPTTTGSSSSMNT
jgi:hypothetical protein